VSPILKAFQDSWKADTTVYNKTLHGSFNTTTKLPLYDPNGPLWDTDYADVGDGLPDIWGMLVYDTVFFLAAALAGLASGVVPHQGLTNVEVTGFDDFSRSYKLFNETQLNRMAEAGVWIVTQDRDGTPFTRHALTTDMLDLNRREEMIRRNVDSISYLFLRRLRPYIGRTNATPVMVDYLDNRVKEIIRFLESSGYTQELGTQLISGSIRVLQLHPLLKDRIEIVLDLVVPAPLNNIELHLVV
jgi:hypothetical protein